MNGQSNERQISSGRANARLIDIDTKRFLPLVIEVMRRSAITQTELADRTGLSRTKISRTLCERRNIDRTTLTLILQVLEIDEMRALLAIVSFGEWAQYFDPNVEILSDLIGELPACLSEARADTVKFPVGLTGARVLARKISALIADNDRETQRRVEQKPIAGL